MFKIGVFLRDRSLARSLACQYDQLRTASETFGVRLRRRRRRNENRSASSVDGDDGKVVKNSERGGRRGRRRFIFTLRSIPELCTLAKRVSASRRASGALPPSLRVQVLSFQLALPGILSISPSPPLLSSLSSFPRALLSSSSFLVGRRGILGRLYA